MKEPNKTTGRPRAGSSPANDTMTLTTLVCLCSALACVAAQQQGGFADYDYQDSFTSNQQQQQHQQAPPSRPAPARFGPRPTGFTTTTTPKPPVAILKQINRHNDDGSYTYGYEGADGSFKIETKTKTGEVMGKYGYVDDEGKVRTVEYGANRFGFQPSGTGITVPPPTLVDESTRRGPDGEIIEDDGSYYAEQEAPRQAPRPKAARPRPQPQPAPRPRPQPQPQQTFTPYEEQPYIAPVARPRPSSGPVPARAAVAGAIPAGPPQAPPSYQPGPQSFPSAPRPAPAQHFAPRPAPVREHRPSYSQRGLLDDLAQQYALPQGQSSPLHDISFGSYSSQTNY